MVAISLSMLSLIFLLLLLFPCNNLSSIELPLLITKPKHVSCSFTSLYRPPSSTGTISTLQGVLESFAHFHILFDDFSDYSPLFSSYSVHPFIMSRLKHHYLLTLLLIGLPITFLIMGPSLTVELLSLNSFTVCLLLYFTSFLIFYHKLCKDSPQFLLFLTLVVLTPSV